MLFASLILLGTLSVADVQQHEIHVPKKHTDDDPPSLI